eukprot:evm.model.NODE_9838_length_19339_cov_67.359581.5
MGRPARPGRGRTRTRRETETFKGVQLPDEAIFHLVQGVLIVDIVDIFRIVVARAIG